MQWLRNDLDKNPVIDKDYYEWLDKCKEPLRACQGDMYFNDKVEGLETNATPLGEAQEPHLTSILKEFSVTGEEPE